MLTPEFQTKTNYFLQSCRKLEVIMKAHEAEIIKLLVTYETHDAAQDEITRSIEALQGFKDEIYSLDNHIDDLNIATIFPLNLPLYSLIIFGVAPSVYSSNVFIRPPEIMTDMLNELFKILKIDELFSNISLKPSPRHIFIQLYASEADVIIFTGKYENALAIQKQCKQALLIYNGSGVNPFIIFENANIALAADKAVEMRCFNSGQDCAGPDAFFVPASKADEFTENLKSLLDKIEVGDTSIATVRVGKTMKPTYIHELKEWLKDEKQHIVYGGKIDDKNQLVYPTIIRRHIKNIGQPTFHEFFAPYFNVIEYDEVSDLDVVINAPAFRERGMYISIFGDNAEVQAKLDFVQLLQNTIVNDVERGNEQYGGYGLHANFLLFGDRKLVQPVLISRDMHAMLNHRD